MELKEKKLEKNALNRFINETPNISLSEEGKSITGETIVTDSNFYADLEKADTNLAGLVHEPSKFNTLGLPIYLYVEEAKLKLASVYFKKRKNSVDARKLYEDLFIGYRPTLADIDDYVNAYKSFEACQNPDEKANLLEGFKNTISDKTYFKVVKELGHRF